jgi:hypothetical protein
MRRKKQLLTVMLCAFLILTNSVGVIAQSKDKKQETKSTAWQEPGIPNVVFQIGEPPPEPALHIAFAAPGQEVAYAAPQIGFIHNEFSFDGEVVKDAPYSADAVTETIQTLGDGNRIVRNSSARVYRDSAGRTRRERAMKVGGAVGGLRRGSGHDLHQRSGIRRRLQPRFKYEDRA